jgi:hypothetical protein
MVVDDAGVCHLIIGLNRENVDSILRGDVFTLPRRYLEQLTQESDVVVLSAETDDDIAKRFAPGLRPAHRRRQ